MTTSDPTGTLHPKLVHRNRSSPGREPHRSPPAPYALAVTTATREGGLLMPITRHGYATRKRNGSTRAYRKARAQALAGATHCHICGLPFAVGDHVEADHIRAHADNGTHAPSNLRPVHRTCNRRRGRAPLRGGGQA